MGRAAAFEEHKFFCLICGRPGISLPRKKGHRHAAMHRKKLYCPWCKKDVNHIEITTPEEEKQFKEDFLNGVYENEAEESLDFVRSARKR